MVRRSNFIKSTSWGGGKTEPTTDTVQGVVGETVPHPTSFQKGYGIPNGRYTEEGQKTEPE